MQTHDTREDHPHLRIWNHAAIEHAVGWPTGVSKSGLDMLVKKNVG